MEAVAAAAEEWDCAGYLLAAGVPLDVVYRGAVVRGLYGECVGVYGGFVAEDVEGVEVK